MAQVPDAPRPAGGAASWAATRLPGWGELISWPRRWWYEAGTEPDRLPEVRTFVLEVADRITKMPPASERR